MALTPTRDARPASKRLLRLAAALLLLWLLVLLPTLWRGVLATAVMVDTVRPGRTGLLAYLTPRPVRIGTRTPTVSGTSPADLYLPGQGSPRRVVLLIHGVNETGKDDPRLIDFAMRLARAQSAVFVPDFPNFRRMRVRPSDSDAVALAYADLARRFGDVCQPRRAEACGIISFSYGVGPALIAAADPRIRESVGFEVTLGGYADLKSVIRFVTTGDAGDPRVQAKPFPWARWAFLSANADLVHDPADQARLAEIARLKIASYSAPVDSLVSTLGPEGRAVWDLVTNRDPARLDALLARADPEVRQSMVALSPIRRLKEVRARLFIVHGVGDRSIPFTESLKLARAAPDPSKVKLTLTRIFGHVDPELPKLGASSLVGFYIPEAWRMIRVTFDILSQSR